MPADRIASASVICDEATVVVPKMNQAHGTDYFCWRGGDRAWLLHPAGAPVTMRGGSNRKRRSSMIETTKDQQQLDTAALIVAIARGDRTAFAALFNHYAPRIKAMFLKGGLDAARAEEIAQEAMLTVWRRAGLFDPAGASPSGWIFAIARNLRIDLSRSDQRGQRFLELARHEPAEPSASVLDALIDRQSAERVKGALAALGNEQRKVVELSFFEGRPHPEIAAMLGIPLGTVKSRLRLAMQHLRQKLEKSI